MEVYSARRPVKQGVTIAVSGVLLLLAVLQSISMVRQKRQDWMDLLVQVVQVQPQLQIRIPAQWRRSRGGSPDVAEFVGTLGDAPGTFTLQVQRVVGLPALSVEAARDLAFRDLPGGPQVPAAERQTCRLGDLPAELVAFSGELLGRPCTIALVTAVHESYGATILLLVAPDESAFGAATVLRHIAATAELGSRA